MFKISLDDSASLDCTYIYNALYYVALGCFCAHISNINYSIVLSNYDGRKAERVMERSKGMRGVWFVHEAVSVACGEYDLFIEIKMSL